MRTGSYPPDSNEYEKRNILFTIIIKPNLNMFNLDLTASQKNEKKIFAFIIEEFIYMW